MTDMPPIMRVGVVGAGQMGAGIAQVCAMSGLHVLLFDARAEAAGTARDGIGRTMDRQIAKGAMEQSARDDAMGRIAVATDIAEMGDRELVVEAVTEREAAKKAVYAALTPHLSAGCLLASNTSSISITRLGAASDRPDRFIGMHFMYPAPKMKLIEIIRGIATGEPAFQATVALSERLGKTVAVSEDFPAFIVNRVLVPMINEAIYRAPRRHRLERRRHRRRDEARHQPARWGRSSSPISSASIPACRSCRCCTRDWATANTGRARCW